MRTTIALLAFNQKTGRLTISCERNPLDTIRALLVDGKHCSGHFVDTPYGALYNNGANADDWGLPGLGFGDHPITVRVQRNSQTSNAVGLINVPNPPSTLGPNRVQPFENLLPFLWDAGFRTEQNLLNPFSIACGESGFYSKARNWLPSQGFRPVADTLGVAGPDAAWNRDHTQQGSSDRGLFQINWFFHKQFTDAQCDDPAQACKAIAVMSNNGADWRAWGFGAGAEHYSQFWDQSVHGYPALRPLVQAFLATKA